MSRRPAPPDVLGIAEVAQLAGVARQTVSSWLDRGVDHIPQPARLACGAVWRRDVMQRWLADTGRLADRQPTH